MERGEQGMVEPWERLSTRHVAEYEMFKVREDRSRSPEDGKEQTFHVADSPGGVVILALTPQGELVMVEQWRHGRQEVTLELPAGMTEQGERPEQSAARELREETGFTGGEGRVLGRIDLNPSWQSTMVDVVLIRDARRTGDKELDDAESTCVRLVAPGDLRDRILAGEVQTGTTIAALAFLYWTRPG